MPYTIQRENAARDLEAVRDAIRQSPLTVEVYETLVGLADSIEEQVKPAVEDPEEFASVVRAGIDGLPDRVLWQRSASGYWFSETSRRAWWSDLHQPEVLRAGLSEIPSESQKAAQDDAYMLGRTELRAQIHDRVLRMLDTAISAERKNALERVITAVEELAP